MTAISRAGVKEASLLSEIARVSFIESHGHSAPEEDIQSYISRFFSEEIFAQELADDRNIYHIISCNQHAAGYSKIKLNSAYPDAGMNNLAKLERIYLLKEYYNLKLGQHLLDFLIDRMKQENQSGIWLYVWKENERAVGFYRKNGFQITGSHDFKISETHSNPNHRMLLLF